MAQFVVVSREEIEVGLKYAADKDGILLDADMLRTLANGAGALRKATGRGLYEAATVILKKYLTQRGKDEQARYAAYFHAAMKIFNRRRVLQQKAAAMIPKPAKVPPKVKKTASKKEERKIPITVGKKGQLKWLL